MRTLVVVVVLVGLALAAGSSFVVRAQDDGAGAATLEQQCLPATLPSGVDTLVSCTFTARNTGDVPLRNPILEFLPGTGPLPDAYYFVSATSKATGDQAVYATQLNYGLGDIAPDDASTISIGVIVRASHAFSIDAVLRSTDAGQTYARVALSAAVEAAPASRVSVTLKARLDAAGQPTPIYTLDVHNGTNAVISGGKLRLSLGEADLKPGDGWETAPYRPAIKPFGAIEPGGDFVDDRVALVSNGGGCVLNRPAVVVDAVVAGSQAESESAAIGDTSVPSGDWVEQSPSPAGSAPAQPAVAPGAGQVAFPDTGSGAAHATGPHGHDLLLAAAVGLLLIAAGISVRRAHRR